MKHGECDKARRLPRRREVRGQGAGPGEREAS